MQKCYNVAIFGKVLDVLRDIKGDTSAFVIEMREHNKEQIVSNQEMREHNKEQMVFNQEMKEHNKRLEKILEKLAE